MKTTRIDGLHYWGAYQPDRRIDFNGWFWERAGGNVLIDPMPLDESQLAFIKERGGARWILVNNAEHMQPSTAAQSRSPNRDGVSLETERRSPRRDPLSE